MPVPHHKTVLIILTLILQTIIVAQMLSTGELGTAGEAAETTKVAVFFLT